MLALSEVKASFELRREEQVAEATKKGQQVATRVGRSQKKLEENRMKEGIPANCDVCKRCSCSMLQHVVVCCGISSRS